MDAIVKEVGLKNNCTFCGVFRRQALDRGALLTKCNKIVTGTVFVKRVGVIYVYSIKDILK